MMIDGIPAPGPSIFTKKTLLDDLWITHDPTKIIPLIFFYTPFETMVFCGEFPHSIGTISEVFNIRGMRLIYK